MSSIFENSDGGAFSRRGQSPCLRRSPRLLLSSPPVDKQSSSSDWQNRCHELNLRGPRGHENKCTYQESVFYWSESHPLPPPPLPREDYFLVVEIQERNCRTRLCVWEENTSFYKSHFSPSPPTVIFFIPSGLKAYFAPNGQLFPNCFIYIYI